MERHSTSGDRKGPEMASSTTRTGSHSFQEAAMCWLPIGVRGGDAHETRREAAAGEVVGKAGRIGVAGVCYLLFPRYSASDTSSNHLEPPPKPTLICTSCCAAAAPCQCTMFGAVYSLPPMPN